MGYLVKGYCHAALSDATDAFFAAEAVRATAGTMSYVLWYEKASAPSSGWVVRRQSITSSGVVSNMTSAPASTPSFPSCDATAAFFDGLTLGWGVVAAMVAAWAFRLMTKGLHR